MEYIGYQDQTHSSQNMFRTMLKAISFPGSIFTVPENLETDNVIYSSTANIIFTLFDIDTKIFIDSEKISKIQNFITFNTNANCIEKSNHCDFAIIQNKEFNIENFNLGTDEYPDNSSTIIIEVEDLINGEELIIEGPGIEKTKSISPTNLPKNFQSQWQNNNFIFPRGVDLILTCKDDFFCLPRTSKVLK